MISEKTANNENEEDLVFSPYDCVELRDVNNDNDENSNGDDDDDDLVLSQFVCVGAGGQESPLES